MMGDPTPKPLDRKLLARDLGYALTRRTLALPMCLSERVETKVDESLFETRITPPTVRFGQQPNGISKSLVLDKMLSRRKRPLRLNFSTPISERPYRRLLRLSLQAESNHSSLVFLSSRRRRGL